MRLRPSMLRALATASLVTALPAAARAQLTITLESSVRDPQGQPVAGAQVAVVNPATNERRSATTSETGRVRVLGLAPGSYQVTVRAIGFEPNTQSVELLLGQRANLVFEMRPTATQLSAVAVQV